MKAEIKAVYIAPSGFKEPTVWTSIDPINLLSVEFLIGGRRIYVSEREGKLRIQTDGQMTIEPDAANAITLTG